jgi:hypothetical protein
MAETEAPAGSLSLGAGVGTTAPYLKEQEMVVAETTPLHRRLRTAGFLFFLALIAVSITASFIGVLRGLDAKVARDPLPAICPPAPSENSHG